MKTGFLIINYNDYETTSKLINNIKNYKTLDKIVVVDNCSTDDSYKKLKQIKINNLEIIKSKENKGYGAGINFGCKYLKKELDDCYIIVSNPDIIIKKEKDIIDLINTFDNKTAIVSPIVDEHGTINRGWKMPTPLQETILNIPLIHRYLRPKMIYYPDNYYNKKIVDVDIVSGCFFIIKSSDLEKANYFDENIFLYYEENIIAKKIQKINKKIKINTQVKIIHDHSVTIDKNLKKTKKLIALKKSQMYFEKNYNNANTFEIILLYITNFIAIFVLGLINLFK